MSQDLAYTLVASFGIFFMGTVVYFHDKKSVTNRLFFLMSLSTVFWSLANYFSINVDSSQLLIWTRLVLFFATPHAVLFLLFIHNFPSPKLTTRKSIFWLIILVLILTMIATVSPYVFSGINSIEGRAVPIAGMLMPLFASVVLGSLVFGLILIIKKYKEAKDTERTQWKYMLVGVSLSYILLIITNFLFVVMFGIIYFIKLGPLFMLPAIFGMGYAILKHKLLHVKTIATELLTFVILSISLFEVLTAKGGWELLLRIGLFSLFFIFGLFLIRSVLNEVEQRERLEILTKELESANVKLKELDKIKSEFLSFASHQVKTPMSVVKGYATLIFDGTYGEVSDKIKETALKIKESADKMIALVNNLLDLRKIEEGKMEFKFEKIDLVKIVDDTVEELKQLAQSKNLDLSFETSLKTFDYGADSQKLRQVFQNLIDNSIKYTETGWIKVKLIVSSEFVEISVSDSGRGISKELLPQLFEQFIRDAKEIKKIEGTGLGLYIAKQIITAHHGQIWVESPGIGQGSLFHVKLPIKLRDKFI